MFEAFAHFQHWFAANNITKPVTVVLRTDAITADRIGHVLRNDLNKLSQTLPTSDPIREGQIYGIHFVIEPAEAPTESWREKLAAALDAACEVDVSASDIDRTPVTWWKWQP